MPWSYTYDKSNKLMTMKILINIIFGYWNVNVTILYVHQYNMDDLGLKVDNENTYCLWTENVFNPQEVFNRVINTPSSN